MEVLRPCYGDDLQVFESYDWRGMPGQRRPVPAAEFAEPILGIGYSHWACAGWRTCRTMPNFWQHTGALPARTSAGYAVRIFLQDVQQLFSVPASTESMS